MNKVGAGAAGKDQENNALAMNHMLLCGEMRQIMHERGREQQRVIHKSSVCGPKGLGHWKLHSRHAGNGFGP